VSETKQDVLMRAAKAYAEQSAQVAEAAVYAADKDRESRQAGCRLSNLRSDLQKLRGVLDAAIADVGVEP